MAFLRGCSGLLLLAAARGLSAADPAMDAASLVQVVAKPEVKPLGRPERVEPLGDVKRKESQMKELQRMSELQMLGGEASVWSSTPDNSSHEAPSNGTAGKKMHLYESWAQAASHDIMKNFVGMRGVFTQYRQALIIINVFLHFDANGDGSLDKEELSAVLSYIGGSWDEYRQKKLVSSLDHVVVDGRIQPSEFFFWFTWPQMDSSMDFDAKLKEMKAKAVDEKRHHTKETIPKNTKEDKDIPLLDSSDVPEGTVVRKLFGRFTQFQEAVRILFFYKTFDANVDHKIDSVEMVDMMDFLEPADWTRPEIDALIACLDMITKDKTVELNEFFYWFTASFMTVWEPAIHTSHLKKNEEKEKEKAAYKELPQRVQ